MSPKRKNKPDKSKNNPIHGYLPVFSPDFPEDLAWWYRNEPKKEDKILDLIADILDGDPFTGVGTVGTGSEINHKDTKDTKVFWLCYRLSSDR